MAEVWFYHLDNSKAEQELPGLLQRGLARALRMAVVSTTAESLKELSLALWGYQDTAFICHGMEGEPNPAQQFIYLCTDDNPPNGAAYRFYINGALPQDLARAERASIMLDGHNEAALAAARTLWRSCKAQQLTVKYWKQDEQGRWVDQAAA